MAVFGSKRGEKWDIVERETKTNTKSNDKIGIRKTGVLRKNEKKSEKNEKLGNKQK